MTAEYETNAGDSFAVTLRLMYQTNRVERLPNRRDYSNIAIFFRPGPQASRWNASTGDFSEDRPIDVRSITITPQRQPVTTDDQQVTFQVSVPGTFAMTELLAPSERDKVRLTMAAAYVGASEAIPANGPRGRTWDVAKVTVNRRPSVAILTGADRHPYGEAHLPDTEYFENARAVFRKWMMVVDLEGVRNLRGAIAWLEDNAPEKGLPWGVVHIVGHSDGRVWLINRWPDAETPSVPSRIGWYELEPTHIRGVADELRRSGHQPLARRVASDSEVVFHLCNFARDNDELLEASRSLFAAAPPVHGPRLFVTFGNVASGPQPAGAPVESVSRALPNGNYQTVEISPNALSSTNFRHIR